MSAQDDDAWFESLAGRSPPGTDDTTALEARLLREAARTWKPLDALTAEPADLASLRTRAAKAGVLKPRRAGWASLWDSCDSCADRWQRLRERPVLTASFGLGFAAVLATVVFSVMPPAPGPAPETVLRGASPDGVVLLRDGEPAVLRDRIAAELTQAGVDVRRYERLGRFGLDAQLRVPPSAGEAAVLTRYKLQPPKDGGLQLEVERAGP